MRKVFPVLLVAVIVFCFSFPAFAAESRTITPEETITVYNNNGDSFVLPVIADAYDFQFLYYNSGTGLYYLYFLVSSGPFSTKNGNFLVPSGFAMCYPVNITDGSYEQYLVSSGGEYKNPNYVVYSNFDIVSSDGVLLYAADTIEHYTVSFVTGFEDEGFSIDPVTIVAGSSLTLPAVDSYNGYSFVGWYYDSSFQNVYDASKVIDSDLTLYARFEAPAVSSDAIIDAINNLTSRFFPGDVLSVPFAQYSVTDTLLLLCFVVLFLIMLINLIRSVF